MPRTAKTEQTNTTNKSANNLKKGTDKKNEAANEFLERRKEEMLKAQKAHRRNASIVLFAIGVLLLLFSIIGLISSIVSPDNVNLLDAIYFFLCGMFGAVVFATGPIVIYVAILIASDRSRTSILTKVLQIMGGIILLCTAIQIIFVGTVGENTANLFEAIGKQYTDGINLRGGGVIAALPAWLLLLFGNVGAIILIVLICFVFVMIISRKTLMEFLNAVGKPVKKAANTAKEKHKQHKEEMELLKSRFPDNIILYVAEKDGEVLGGTVLYVTGQVVHAQYISASPDGKRLRVIDAIYDVILNNDYAGFRHYFDFGKSTEDYGNYLNENLIYQKEGFGGRGVCYDTYEWEM